MYLYREYRQCLQQAERYIEQGDWAKAASAYRQSATLMEEYSQLSNAQQVRDHRIAQARHLALAAEKLERVHLNPASAGNLDAEDAYAEVIQSLIHRSAVTWEDVGGLHDVKRAIKTTYALAMAEKPDGILLDIPHTLLLYGPPGTGKTLLAAAASSGLDAVFLGAKLSDILSKFFGESSKLLGALYAEAREQAPAVVFLDEFDAVGRIRGISGEIGAERRLLATLLTELDGLNSKDNGKFVFTIAATNRPWDIDAAVRSRLTRKFYIPLPDAEARKQILKIHLQHRGHLIDMPVSDLVERTAGYSGREIARLCEHAIAAMIDDVNPDLEATVDQGKEAISQYRIAVRPLQNADFAAAFDVVGAAETTDLEVDRFARWQVESG